VRTAFGRIGSREPGNGGGNGAEAMRVVALRAGGVGGASATSG
jgi:hypothetical protein